MAKNIRLVDCCSCGQFKSVKAACCRDCFKNPKKAPADCVCGAPKPAEDSLCAGCLARLEEIREKRNSERVAQYTRRRPVDGCESVPRILERMNYLPSFTYARANRDVYGDDNAFDDVVKLYENNQ